MSRSAPQTLAVLCDRWGLDAVYAFGSRSAEVRRLVTSGHLLDSANRSDVDIGVLPAPGTALNVSACVELAAALEELFAAPRVDLVILSQAPPFLALDVIKGEELLVVNRHRAAEFELYVLRRAGDLAPFERTRRQMILAGGRG